MSNKENKSPSETKITTVEKTAKVKDPRKVELGKRLARISKEAKERKARLGEAAKVKNEILNYIDFRYVVGGVMLIAAVGGLYFAYKKDNREIKEEVKEEEEEKKKNNNVNKIIKTKQKCNIENL